MNRLRVLGMAMAAAVLAVQTPLRGESSIHYRFSFPAPEHHWLQISHARELLGGNALEHSDWVDLLRFEHVGDRVGCEITLDSLAIEILLQASLGRAGAEDLRPRVLLRVFRVVEESVIDKAADRVICVRRRVLLLDQFSVQRPGRVGTR